MFYTILIVWFLGALALSLLLNKVSEKIKYPYGWKGKLVVVIGTIGTWFLIYNKYGVGNLSNLDILVFAFIVAILWAIIVIDYKYYEIPNEYNLALFLLGLVYTVNNYDRALAIILAGAGIFFFYYVVRAITKGNLGGGDVRLAGSLGLFFSSFHLAMEFVSVTFIFGAIISLALLLFRVKTTGDKIAFGPYISLAFMYVVLG